MVHYADATAATTGGDVFDIRGVHDLACSTDAEEAAFTGSVSPPPLLPVGSVVGSTRRALRYGDACYVTLPFVSLDSIARDEMYGLVHITAEAFSRWTGTLKEVRCAGLSSRRAPLPMWVI